MRKVSLKSTSKPIELAVMRALILGASGQLGWQCMKDLPALNVDVCGLDRRDLDVSNDSESRLLSTITERIKAFRPDWVINAIAYTAVDRAEDEPELAMKVNAEFPDFLASAVNKVSPESALLHCSSDYVFDGMGSEAFAEDHPTKPLSVYGESKLAGEQAVMVRHDRAWVLRFSWVVGEHGQNFAKTMLRLAFEREHLRVVGDQFGVPSPTPFLVREFARLIKRSSTDPEMRGLTQGRLFHVVPSGETTWHAYARRCIELAGEHPVIGGRLRLSREDIESIETKDYPTKAVRPMNSRLNCNAWCAWHGLAGLPTWEEETVPVIHRIIEQAV